MNADALLIGQSVSIHLLLAVPPILELTSVV